MDRLKAGTEVRDLGSSQRHGSEGIKCQKVFEIMETAVMLDVISKHEGKKSVKYNLNDPMIFERK